MTRERALLAAFAAVAAAHLAALPAGAELLEHLTKPALMPLLAAYAYAAGAPRLLVAALLLSCGGDVLLQVGGDTPFLLGMGCFAAAHVAYVTLFVRGGALAPRRRTRTAGAAAGYGVAWAVLIALLWPDLGDLRVPVACYSLLLASTAVTAAGIGVRAAAGGALFLLSDTLIATDVAGWAQPPQASFCVMATYIAAQYLLATGAPGARGERARVPEDREDRGDTLAVG